MGEKSIFVLLLVFVQTGACMVSAVTTPAAEHGLGLVGPAQKSASTTVLTISSSRDRERRHRERRHTERERERERDGTHRSLAIAVKNNINLHPGV